MGRLVPAGTGMEYYRQVGIAGEDVGEEAPCEQPLEPSAGYDEEAGLQYAGCLKIPARNRWRSKYHSEGYRPLAGVPFRRPFFL